MVRSSYGWKWRPAFSVVQSFKTDSVFSWNCQVLVVRALADAVEKSQASVGWVAWCDYRLDLNQRASIGDKRDCNKAPAASKLWHGSLEGFGWFKWVSKFGRTRPIWKGIVIMHTADFGVLFCFFGQPHPDQSILSEKEDWASPKQDPTPDQNGDTTWYNSRTSKPQPLNFMENPDGFWVPGGSCLAPALGRTAADAGAAAWGRKNHTGLVLGLDLHKKWEFN